MKRLKKRFLFKYKLSFLLVLVVVIVATVIGVQQLLLIRKTLTNNFEQGKQLVKDRVINHVMDIDNLCLLIEEPLNREGKLILEKVNQAYEKTGSINLNLATYLAGKEEYDLYIIDENNIIVSTTDPVDYGLDFNRWPDKAVVLDEIRQKGEYFADRVDLSSLNSVVKKYCYYPSKDRKYIFELGIDLNKFSDKLRGQSFENIEGTIPAEYDFVNAVAIYDDVGNGYKKDKDGKAVSVIPEHLKYLKKAALTMETVEVKGEYEGESATFVYVPYHLIDSVGMNRVNIIEIIYNDHWLNEALENNLKSIIISITVGVLLAVLISFYLARNVTKPIEILTEAAREISKGNFDVRTKIKTNDEFRILSLYFDKMARDIQALLNERYEYENELEEKNAEIFRQKEEINALYQVTASINEELETLLAENENSYFQTVTALAKSVDAMDSYTGGHCERVMEYSVAIAQEMGLSANEIRDLRFGSILHDIGKIGIPTEILNKSKKYTVDDYEIMKQHPTIGQYILKDVHFLERCKKIVYEHHERIDGKGYPRGLKGDQIDLLSKIVCVADAYDAMTSSRPYRKKPLTKEKAIEELINNKGTQFDPQIVDVFIKVLTKDSKDKEENYKIMGMQ